MAYENLKKTGITYLLTKLKGIFLQIKDAVRTVNGNEADENGNIELLTIPYAQQLQSASNQRTDGEYIERTAGGSASIVTGVGSLIKILGNSTHEGYVAESIEMTVTPVDPDDPNAITATINEATFKSQVFTSGTTTFTYGDGSWDSDPATYGITVTGTPAAGDVIEVVYVMEERGTIYVANPTGLVTTGWNLYNNDTGYARVLKYSDDPDQKFGISGTYTALKFSATLDGAKTDITVSGGLFSVPSDGYVFVTGGNSTDTAIWMTWADWTSGYEGTFVAYNEEEIDFSNEMATYFPYGLLRVGDVADELNFNIGSAISRVERLAYSAGNRAIAEASGREYEFDQDYIYLERETPVTNEIDVDNEIRVNDHGMESISYTDIPVEVEMLYGDNLKNKLERNVLTISQQSLTASEIEQVSRNVGLQYFRVGVSMYGKTLANLIADISPRANGATVLYFVSGTICGDLIGSTSANGMTIITKTSAGYAEYMCSNGDVMGHGWINISSGTANPRWTSITPTVTNQSTSFSDVTVATGTDTNIGSVALTPGEYMIIGFVGWANNSSGYRRIWWSTSSGGSQINLASSSMIQAVNGDQTRQHLPITYKVSSNTTIYLVARQNSGSSLTASGRYSIVKIR